MGIAPGMMRVQLTVAERVIERLEILAADAGMTKSQYVTMLVNLNWKEERHTVKGDEVNE